MTTPELTGTPKQVAWAEKIRSEIVADLQDLEAFVKNTPPGYKGFDVAVALAIIAETKANPSAKWWIDNRDQAIGTRTWLLETIATRQPTPAQPQQLQDVRVAVKPRTKAEIMQRAWAIARAAAARFGGSSKQYLAGAMAQAWAESR